MTVMLLEPLTNSIEFLVNTVQLFVGGIFGIYLILVILKWKEARDLKRIMKSVKDELVLLNKTVKRLGKNKK